MTTATTTSTSTSTRRVSSITNVRTTSTPFTLTRRWSSPVRRSSRPAIDLPYAVSVLDRDLLREQGSPLVIDLFKNLTANGAVIGEAFSGFNGLGWGVAENVANVNLRSLGASRTLVLVNNRRQAPVPARLFGGRFVDVNMIPSIAVERIEVLKEGAAAIYGSDAVAGVQSDREDGPHPALRRTPRPDRRADGVQG